MEDVGNVIDGILPDEERAKIHEFLAEPGWDETWRSRPDRPDALRFRHKHFAGNIFPDKIDKGGRERPYDCLEELRARYPLLSSMWDVLAGRLLPDHTLVRCYANCHPYGRDGCVHYDSKSPDSMTAIYYPHPVWSPDWGGETVIFNAAKDEIVRSVYPRPGRLFIFPGNVPHIARGVSKMCPVDRVTLMFKVDSHARLA